MAKPKKPEPADDLIKAAREAFALCEEAETENRQTAREDALFALKGEQWPEAIRKQREADGRPCLTFSKLPTHIRQVVNDARQNKPSIKVMPADSGADPETAEIINGLIRNIEYTSSADVAYDTATENAVSMGFGYIRVGLDYAYDDTFDLDITINRVANPLSVYGDPNSTAADSSDWDVSFVVDRLSEAQFKREYPGADTEGWGEVDSAWYDQAEKTVMVAEWWTRDHVDSEIVKLSTGQVVDAESLKTDPDLKMLVEAGIVQVVTSRPSKTCKVKQRFMSGREILKERDWPGKFIPIIPVYGVEFNIEGKRYFRSLIHDAIGAQQMYNYQRSTATELVGLAPRVPYIGPKGAFDTDQERWNTANTKNHAYLEYDIVNGGVPPQRQPMDTGRAAGAIQEALAASDDIKAIIGQYDASLGARSNETSGRAIMARQREGDVSTFHFVDNMARAIRHTGRVLIDLIPKVYDTPRIVRVIGEDGEQAKVQINQQAPKVDPKTGQPMVDEMGQAILAMHDLSAGKYDLTVKTGPSFTTRREEAAAQMTEMIRAFPEAAPIVGPELAKNLDWPGADKIAEKMEALESGKLPDEAQKAMQDMQAQLQKLAQENQQLKQDKSEKIAEINADLAVEKIKLQSQRELEEMKLASHHEIEIYKANANAAAVASRPMPNSRPSA
jgi:hypothetical protein